jgi:glycosyltransferase involved in cell wall biosynthesis
MQRLPLVTRNHQPFLLLYPLAFESFDFGDYDVVVSNSSAFCKGVVTGPRTLHLCYCLTPMRWVWSYRTYVERERLGRAARLILPAAISQLRSWDVATAQNVDRFAAISRAVAARIRKFYRREATIIYPPVHCERFEPEPGSEEDYYLVVSRLIPYKRVDLAIDAFTRLGLPLKVAGDGRDRAALQARASRNVEFVGRVSDREVAELIQGCRGFVFPGEEDFGIAPVEAQAAGRPVVAFGAGGALDTVLDGETGVHFAEQSVESLSAAVRRLESMSLDSDRIAAHARTFDTRVFRERITSFVAGAEGERRVATPVG